MPQLVRTGWPWGFLPVVACAAAWAFLWRARFGRDRELSPALAAKAATLPDRRVWFQLRDGTIIGGAVTRGRFAASFSRVRAPEIVDLAPRAAEHQPRI